MHTCPKAHVLAGIAGKLINKPIVATVHGMHVTAHELGIAHAVQSHLITNCTEAYIQALALGIPKKRVSLVRNGVDTNIFKPLEMPEAFRKENNIPLHVPLVGFVGRLDFEKGPDFFIYAAEYIHTRKPDVHFIMAGDGNMLQELQHMRARFHLQTHLHFISWHTQPQTIYPCLDVLAHTSRSDGTSLVLLEAMACGCLTAAFGIGGVYEIIENNSTGLLAGYGDCESLGRSIIHLLELNEQKRKAISEAARNRVMQYFNAKNK